MFRVFYSPIKRAIDIVVSFTLLVCLAPVFLVVLLAVKLTSDGSAIFWSERLGLNGKTFRMPKFRSMTSCSKVMSREAVGQGDIKITALGRLLRKSSLDEIPQLFSVLIGDMSLIGPRPLLHNDDGLDVRNQYPEIYSVRPGITGLAQVNGRNFVTARNKSRYDAFYVERVCLWLDTKIALRTLVVIFNTKNVL